MKRATTTPPTLASLEAQHDELIRASCRLDADGNEVMRAPDWHCRKYLEREIHEQRQRAPKMIVNMSRAPSGVG